MTLNRFDRWEIIVYTVKKAENKDIRVGHTLLQKLIYLLQEGLDVPLGYEYKLHYFGPYSEFLWGEITSLRDYNVLEIKTDSDGYGYNINFKNEAEWLKARKENVPKEKIDTLLRLLEDRLTRDLELFATTHYIYKKYQEEALIDENRVVSQVIALKPHFTEQQIEQALIFLKTNGLLK